MTPTTTPNKSAAYGLATFAIIVWLAGVFGASLWVAGGFLILAAIAYSQKGNKS